MRSDEFLGRNWIIVVLLVALSQICFSQIAKQNSLVTSFLDLNDSNYTKVFEELILGESNFNFNNTRGPKKCLVENWTVDCLTKKLEFGISDAQAVPYDSVLFHLINCEELAIQQKDTQKIVVLQSLLAMCFSKMANSELSLEKLHSAMILAENLEFKNYVCWINNSIGNSLKEQKQFEKAIHYYERALNCNNAINDSIAIAFTLNNMGEALYSLRDNNEALEYYYLAKDIAQRTKNLELLSIVSKNLGKVLLKLQRYTEAKHKLHESIRVSKTLNCNTRVAQSQIVLAEIFSESKSDSAIHYAELALRTGKAEGNLCIQEEASHLLYIIYQNVGLFDQAIKNQSEWITLKDSIKRRENIKGRIQKEIQVEFEKQQLMDQLTFEEEINNEIKSKERIAHFMNLGLGTFIICSIIVLAYRHRRINTEREYLLEELKTMKERFVVQSVSYTDGRKDINLNKHKIENILSTRLGESSWNILNIIYNDPAISNQELAGLVFLSQDGLQTALRRMYKQFDLQSSGSRNKKIALIIKALKLSLE